PLLRPGRPLLEHFERLRKRSRLRELDVSAIVRPQQRVHFAAQLEVGAAGIVEPRSASLRCAVERGLEDLLHPPPAFTLHAETLRPWRAAARLWPSASRARPSLVRPATLRLLRPPTARRSGVARRSCPCAGRRPLALRVRSRRRSTLRHVRRR